MQLTFMMNRWQMEIGVAAAFPRKFCELHVRSFQNKILRLLHAPYVPHTIKVNP